MKQNRFLSKEEELELGKNIFEWKQDKDNKEKYKLAVKSAQKLFKYNKPLAIKMAKDFIFKTECTNYTLEDAIMDAYIGLMTAIWRYDFRRNTKITTVARMPIYKELVYSCNTDNSLIAFKDLSNVEYAKAKRKWLEENLEDIMSLKEYVQLHKDEYKNLNKVNRFETVDSFVKGVTSLDFEIKNDNSYVTLGTLLKDDNYITYYDSIDIDKEDLFSPELMKTITNKLTPIQQKIIFYEYDDSVEIPKEDFMKQYNLKKRSYGTERNKALRILKAELE